MIIMGLWGQPFMLKFDLKSEVKVEVSDVRLDIRIDDALGQKYAWLSTSVFPFKSQKKDDVIKTISFHLEKT
jgi:lipopolysaccharide transport system ATP-binding protein